MEQRTFIISNTLGMHLRPATKIVKTAAAYRSKIMIQKDDLMVNGKSIMGLVVLAAPKGTAITVRADGDDEVEALDAMEALFEDKFGEE